MDNSIARNITKELMKVCTAQKMYVNENFVLYFVNLLLLDPNWGITSDFVSSRDNVNSFIVKVTAELEAHQFPKFVTLQMQFYFSCNKGFLETVVKRQRKEVTDRLNRLKNDIIKTNELDGQLVIDMYLRKIICYITLLSGLGNPTTAAVYPEVLKALNSIMDEAELLEFAQLPKDVKEDQLDRMRKIVCGIRLFNKDCRKGGEGIEDLPILLNKAMRVYTQQLQENLHKLMVKVNHLTTIMDKCYMIVETEDGIKMTCTLPSEIVDVYIHNIRDLLILYRQYEVIIRKLMEDMESHIDCVQIVCQDYEEIMKNIHDVVYMRIAIPANTIFPFFESLSDVWSRMQDIIFIITKHNQILTNLDAFSKYTCYNIELYNSIVEGGSTCTDEDRLKETACLTLSSDNEKVEIMSVDEFPDMDKINLEYLGFCCWKLVETDGGLLPGNPQMGIAKFEEKYYVFSSPTACTQFSKKPKEFILRVLEIARKRPQLINFLHLKDQMQKVTGIKQLTEKKVVKRIKDKSVQSLDFDEILPTNLDRTYKWNIWDLKREAILLANLSKCRTVSCQTWKTPSRNAIKSQTYEMRDKNLQTKRDNYSNVPKPSNFIYGLRGRKDDQQFIIDLTRPVDE